MSKFTDLTIRHFNLALDSKDAKLLQRAYIDVVDIIGRDIIARKSGMSKKVLSKYLNDIESFQYLIDIEKLVSIVLPNFKVRYTKR